MNHGVADHLMHQWLAQVIRRQRGEATGLRAIALHLAGNVSDCCGVPVHRSRTDEYWLCSACRQRCRIGLWRPRKGNRVRPSHTRKPQRGLEDARRAREVDGFLWLQRMVEPRPRDCGEQQWHRYLAAYGLQLLEGYCDEGSTQELARFSKLADHRMGSTWTTWTYRAAVHEARRVLARRASRERPDHETASARLRAAVGF